MSLLHEPSDPPWRFQIEPELSTEEFIDVLKRSALGVRRPLEKREVISGMLRAADVIGTVRTAEGLLIAVARALTDFCYVTYLSDLAVDEAYQRRGIGQRLLKFTHDAAGATTRLVLIAAPAAESYYPRIGLVKHPSCWIAEPGWGGTVGSSEP